MANSGSHTNQSQFFVTLSAQPHLNFKHSIFGHVVGGIEVLNEMEKVETDEDDIPLKEIKITKTVVIVDPFEEEKKLIVEPEVRFFIPFVWLFFLESHKTLCF